MSEVKIHESAIIHESAKIGTNVTVGPYAFIGEGVEIGDNSIIHHHAVIDKWTKLGANNQVFQFASIGADPQDYSYKPGDKTFLEVGDGNIFREFTTINRGTFKENGLTKLGDESLYMAYVHVGHDSIVGNKCTFANSCNLAGHVRIGDNAVLGGGTQISQFVRIGRGSYLGGASGVDRDVPAFCTAFGNRARLKGINIIGMRRMGIDREDISLMVDFYRTMESSPLSASAFIEDKNEMERFENNIQIQEVLEFIRSSKVGIAQYVE